MKGLSSKLNDLTIEQRTLLQKMHDEDLAEEERYANNPELTKQAIAYHEELVCLIKERVR